MTRETRSTGRVSAAAYEALDRLHDKPLNFQAAGHDFRAADGWKIDDYCVELPAEPPGAPTPNGSWTRATSLMADYEFADPSIVRAIYYADQPMAERSMLLEAHFYGLRFHLGVRVGGLVDESVVVDGREVRVWGWNYRTLQGHLEMGQMDYEVWKWLDDGTVEFRIHAVSKAAIIRNPVVRLGFRVFGRWMQRRFARRALLRMDGLVRRSSSTGSTDAPPESRTVEAIDVEPDSTFDR